MLRVVNRFQKLAGFDRAVALASAALTALIPLTIVASALASELGGKGTAERIIDRYELTGGGAEAVKDIFAPPTGTSTSLGIVGFLFLMVTVLSFSRGMQRLIEQTWELSPLSVRNTFNGLLWIAGLALYLVLSGLLHAGLGRSRLELSAALVGAPLTVAFLVWSGRVLSAKRIERHEPAPVRHRRRGAARAGSVGATVYVPHLFSSYATRYGVIGAVFAMISALFIAMVVVVGSAAAGREIDDELGRIRRGEKPAEDEVQHQWDEVTAEARSRWETLREQIQERRRKRAQEKENAMPSDSELTYGQSTDWQPERPRFRAVPARRLVARHRRRVDGGRRAPARCQHRQLLGCAGRRGDRRGAERGHPAGARRAAVAGHARARLPARADRGRRHPAPGRRR